MSTDTTAATPITATSTPAVATPTQHTIHLSDEEWTRVKAALASAARHHGSAANNVEFVQSVRTTHQSLQAEYQALVVRYEAI